MILNFDKIYCLIGPYDSIPKAYSTLKSIKLCTLNAMLKYFMLIILLIVEKIQLKHQSVSKCHKLSIDSDDISMIVQ